MTSIRAWFKVQNAFLWALQWSQVEGSFHRISRIVSLKNVPSDKIRGLAMDVMLKTFTVEGYRSFYHKVMLDFGHPREYGWHNGAGAEASYITNGIVSNALILGVNATGKTNLGYALVDIKGNFLRAVMPTDLIEGLDASYINGDNEKGYAEFSYLFKVYHDEVLYVYRKDAQCRVMYERLEIDGRIVFERDRDRGWIDRSGLGMVGADGLNWDFADEELSVVGYLSNVLPKHKGQTMYCLRRYVSSMSMISVPTHVSRQSAVRSQLRRLVQSPELVQGFEEFIRDFGVDERLEVLNGPDGEPVLYFSHRRRVPFAQACSSGTLKLLQLFAQFRMGGSGDGPSLVYVDEFDASLFILRWQRTSCAGLRVSVPVRQYVRRITRAWCETRRCAQIVSMKLRVRRMTMAAVPGCSYVRCQIGLIARFVA